jgi:hypothetical protein
MLDAGAKRRMSSLPPMSCSSSFLCSAAILDVEGKYSCVEFSVEWLDEEAEKSDSVPATIGQYFWRKQPGYIALGSRY